MRAGAYSLDYKLSEADSSRARLAASKAAVTEVRPDGDDQSDYFTDFVISINGLIQVSVRRARYLKDNPGL